MSNKIKPSEVSDVLLKALQSVNAEEKFDEVPFGLFGND